MHGHMNVKKIFSQKYTLLCAKAFICNAGSKYLCTFVTILKVRAAPCLYYWFYNTVLETSTVFHCYVHSKYYDSRSPSQNIFQCSHTHTHARTHTTPHTHHTHTRTHTHTHHTHIHTPHTHTHARTPHHTHHTHTPHTHTTHIHTTHTHPTHTTHTPHHTTPNTHTKLRTPNNDTYAHFTLCFMFRYSYVKLSIICKTQTKVRRVITGWTINSAAFCESGAGLRYWLENPVIGVRFPALSSVFPPL